METSDTDFYSQCLRVLSPVATPSVANNVTWLELFTVEEGSGARELLQRLALGRSRLISAITTFSNTLFSVGQVSEVATDYLRDVNILLESLDKQSAVKTKSPLLFKWIGSFTSTGPTCTSTAPNVSKLFECPFIIFEICMLLHTLGIVAYLEGTLILNDGDALGDAKLKNASKCFLKSASYFLCLGRDTLPRWVMRETLQNFPPELDEQVSLAFSHLAQASAQQCAVVVALQNGRTTPAILAKLCAAIVQQANDCLTCLTKADKKANMKAMTSSVSTQAAYLREFFSSLSFYYHGMELAAAQKCGDAIACFTRAEGLLKIQSQDPTNSKATHNPERPGLPKQCLSTATVGKFLTLVTQGKATAVRENDLIYYHVVPSAVPLPNGALLNTAVAFSMPGNVDEVVSFAPPSNPRTENLFNFDQPPPAPTPSRAPAPALVADEADGEAQCPACTFLQSPSATACAMCGTPMLKKA